MGKQEVKRVNGYIKIQLFIIYMDGTCVSVSTMVIACPIMDFILLVDAFSTLSHSRTWTFTTHKYSIHFLFRPISDNFNNNYYRFHCPMIYGASQTIGMKRAKTAVFMRTYTEIHCTYNEVCCAPLYCSFGLFAVANGFNSFDVFPFLRHIITMKFIPPTQS